jgi:hypothetical protein
MFKLRQVSEEVGLYFRKLVSGTSPYTILKSSLWYRELRFGMSWKSISRIFWSDEKAGEEVR